MVCCESRGTNMRSLLAATLLVRSLLALANTPLDANLAYNSPFHDYREVRKDISRLRSKSGF